MIATAKSPALIDLYHTGYDRHACQLGVVHLGFGAFHRAHQSVYFDDYMEVSGDLRWGIAAVNLRASESAGFAATQSAENGYLLKTTTPQGDHGLRLVRSHCHFADWSKDAEAAENLLALPSVHLVTITVTESGYYLGNDGSLNIDDSLIADELSGAKAQSVYAFLARALEKRAMLLDKPITIACCDNIRANGKMLRANFLAYLKASERDALADWTKQKVSFPCSMVDRITPRASDELRDEIAEFFPDSDLNPVQAEAFSQWVLEDSFAGVMPELKKAGVQIVGDVNPYEEAKIRILNGGHTALCYLGALAGHKTFDQVMADKQLYAHFDAYERGEVLPGIDFDLPFDKQAYLAEIAARFANHAIADQLERICMDGYSKMPIYIKPTLASCLSQGIVPEYGFASVASWVVYARRFATGKMPIAYHDPYWEMLEPLLADGKEVEFASNKQLWAELPERYGEFVPGIVRAIGRMEEQWPA